MKRRKDLVLLHRVAVLAVSMGLGTQFARDDDTHDGYGSVTICGGKVDSTATSDIGTGANATASAHGGGNVGLAVAFDVTSAVSAAAHAGGSVDASAAGRDGNLAAVLEYGVSAGAGGTGGAGWAGSAGAPAEIAGMAPWSRWPPGTAAPPTRTGPEAS